MKAEVCLVMHSLTKENRADIKRLSKQTQKPKGRRSSFGLNGHISETEELFLQNLLSCHSWHGDF